MSNKLLFCRLGVHTILNGIPILVFQWSTIVLPELLRVNFGITDPSLFSFYASLFYVSYFSGILISCFIWPFVVQRVNKRRCLLFSTLMYGMLTMISGYGSNITFFLSCRFATGMFLNVNTIGKDLLFEFAAENYRQIGLSLDSAITLTMNLAGPFIGMTIYHSTQGDLPMTMIYIGLIYIVVGTVFFITFFLFPYKFQARNSFDMSNNDLNKLNCEEENAPILDRARAYSQIQTKSTKKVILTCIHQKALRNPMLIYGLSVAVANCDQLLTVIFLETSWKEKGLGIEAQNLSVLYALSIIPACILLLSSPSFCPSKVDYSTFMRTFMMTFGFGMFFTPFLRDLIPEKNHEHFTYLVFMVVLIKNCSNARIYAPFIHFHLNKRANRYIRTLINSINFIISTLLNIILVNLIVPLFSVLLYNPRFTQYEPYNKYPLFSILIIIQVGCMLLVEERQNDEILEPVTEI